MFRTSLCNGGNTDDRSSHICIRFFLATSRAGQYRSRCSKVPSIWVQVYARQKPSLLPDQNLHKLSYLYLPDIILDKMVDLFTSWELLPAAFNMG